MKISKGNNKIGKVWNVSLTPIKACKGCEKVCGKDCYALKAYRLYPPAKSAWDHNFDQATNNPDGFFKDIETSLKSYKGKFFRWHVAGDILNLSYFASMVKIAKLYPNIKFLAFTKQYDIVNSFCAGERFNRIPKNLQIIFSAWPELPMDNKNNFPIAYMQDGSETRVTSSEIECPGSCKSCGTCWELSKLKRNVVFFKH